MRYLSVILLLCLFGCHKTETSISDRVDSLERMKPVEAVKYYDGNKVFTDPDNGCQYLGDIGDNTKFTPMINPDGTPKCGKAKP